MPGHLRTTLSPLLISLMLVACGGSGSNNDRGAITTTQRATSISAQEPNAPQATGNTATDGFNWFNFRRQQLGVQTLVRNTQVDSAAQGHSDYQKANAIVTHEQTAGRPGFTGRTASDRLTAAGYRFAPGVGYAYGEVISATSDPSGFNAAEDLIAAIYHRFAIFEPMFKEAGTGSAVVTGGSTYFTANFTANGLTTGLGAARILTYPFANQQRVARNFFSDNESPDPIPARNEVGYPISVHADITSMLGVQSFTVSPRGGAPLAVQLLTHASDPQTRTSVAAIIPLEVLNVGTTYDVQFAGTVDGAEVNHAWSFTTQ